MIFHFLHIHIEHTQTHTYRAVCRMVLAQVMRCNHICREFIWKSSTWLHNIHFYISEKWHSTNAATTTATATAAAAIEAAMFSWMVDKQTNKLCIFNLDVVWKMAFKLTREMYFMPLKMSEHVSSPLPPLFLFYVAIWFLFEYVPKYCTAVYMIWFAFISLLHQKPGKNFDEFSIVMLWHFSLPFVGLASRQAGRRYRIQ